MILNGLQILIHHLLFIYSGYAFIWCMTNKYLPSLINMKVYHCYNVLNLMNFICNTARILQLYSVLLGWGPLRCSPFFCQCVQNIFKITSIIFLVAEHWRWLSETNAKIHWQNLVSQEQDLWVSHLIWGNKERKNHKHRVPFWAQDNWGGKSLSTSTGDASSLE